LGNPTKTLNSCKKHDEIRVQTAKMKLLTVKLGCTATETMKNKTAYILVHEKTDEAKNNLVLKERNHVYDHNLEGKCHNILQNTQMLTFSVLFHKQYFLILLKNSTSFTQHSSHTQLFKPHTSIFQCNTPPYDFK
jgi:hypothetical protein